MLVATYDRAVTARSLAMSVMIAFRRLPGAGRDRARHRHPRPPGSNPARDTHVEGG